MREQNIAAAVDSGGQFLLRRLGFEFDVVTRGQLNNRLHLSGYDVFINIGLDAAFRAHAEDNFRMLANAVFAALE